MRIDKRYRYRVRKQSPDFFYVRTLWLVECQPWWCPKWWPVWWYADVSRTKDDAIKDAWAHAARNDEEHKSEVINLGRLP